MKKYDKIYVPVSGLYKAPFFIVDSKTEYTISKAKECNDVIILTAEEAKGIFMAGKGHEKHKQNINDTAQEFFVSYMRSKGIEM